jgi:sulfatase modifying factor 1
LSAGYYAHGPEHEVTLTDYVLDAYEVSVARYRRCVVAGACTAPSTVADQGCTYTTAAASHELHPVTCVSWVGAQGFCSWDGQRQLPTEAQWEQAARMDTARYAWGDSFSCARAVVGGQVQCDEYAGLIPRPVGSAPTGNSPEGAYDLVGNAAEWVADWFGPYSSEITTNPTGPETGSTRIFRGGNWLTNSADAVSYGRRGSDPDAIGPYSFRCSRAPAP